MTCKKTLTTLLTLLLLLATGCSEQPPAEESCNFVQNKFGRRVSWAQLPIRFYAHYSVADSDVVGQEEAEKQLQGIRAAMQVWNDHFDRPVFELVGRSPELPDAIFTETGEIQTDGYNGIYISESSNFENTGQKDEQARTSISYRGDYIYEADIAIDSSESFYYSADEQDFVSLQLKVSFESLMVHELGHVLGLEHIDDFEGAVMNSRLEFGETRIEITEADYNSLACEYQ